MVDVAAQPTHGQFEALKVAAAGLLYEDARGTFIECRYGDPKRHHWTEDPSLLYWSASINGGTRDALLRRGWVELASESNFMWRTHVTLTAAGRDAYMRESKRRAGIAAERAAGLARRRAKMRESIDRRRAREGKRRK